VHYFSEALGEFALGYFEAGEHPAGGAKNRVARGIIYGNTQFQSSGGSGGALGGVDRLGKSEGNAITAANYAKAYAFGGASSSVVSKKSFEQGEE
jgi:hypothetical protein